MDMVLIQEPWVGADLDRKMTKKHNAYQAYAPEEEWTEWPKVLTYARRKQWPYCLEKKQDCVPSREIIPDILVLELQSG